MTHGKYSAYAHGCRCEECRTAWADYRRDYYHRTRDARVAYSRDYYQRRKDES